tara:strand:+ start:1835 stop:4924 length:3090 start_codon:yes stop_codon:yes gene_type:complete
MATFRTDPITGQTLINKNNQVGKDGFTNNERAGEYGTRNPNGKSNVASKFNQTKPKNEGDPEEAKKFMRAFGMNGLADFYEEQGAAAEKGEVPPFFSSYLDSSGNITGIPTGSSTQGTNNYFRSSNTQDTATVGDANNEDYVQTIEPKRERGNTPLPLANVLEQFATYNNIFSFGCISPQELNYPDETYRKTGIRGGQMVFRSGAGLKSNKKPRTGAEQDYNVDTQYFIDNVEIDTYIAPNKKSRQTNFFQIKFEIREPYSMGQLFQTMQLCAMNAGYKNYSEAPWLLHIMFVGWKDMESQKPTAPFAQKLLPLKIVTVDFEVDTEGSRYNFLCSAFNDEAFNDTTQSIPTDLSVSGNTLEEICQSGFDSVATHLNTHYLKAQANDKVKHEIDEYIIAFPTELSSAKKAELYKSDSKGEQAATTGDWTLKDINYDDAISTVGQKDATFTRVYAGGPPNRNVYMGDEHSKKEFIDGRLGYSVKRSNLSEAIKKVISNKESIRDGGNPGGLSGVNPIGMSKVDPEEPLGGGDSPFAQTSFVYNETSNNFQRGSTGIDPNKRTIQFRAGTKIQRIIEELVLISSYGQSLLSQEPDEFGNLNWFAINAELFIVQDEEAEKKIGRMPRIYVYNVHPRKAHISEFQLPNEAPKGYNELIKQAPKAYNYMYTGLNKDILDFEIRLDNTFYASITPDRGNNKASNSASERGDSDPNFEVGVGGNKGTDTTMLADAKTLATQLSSDVTPLSAGAIAENARIQVARSFNDAIVNSEADMISLNLKILGDPYYIADSGTGNYNAERTSYININADGSIDHQTSDVDIMLQFTTPIDVNPAAGNYLMDGRIIGVSNFSGLYRVISVANRFEGNMFTQDLQLVKRTNYDKKDEGEDNTAKKFEPSKEWVKQAAAVEALYSKDSDEYRYMIAKKDGVVYTNELSGLTGGKASDTEYLAKLQANIKAAEDKGSKPVVYEDRILRIANQGAPPPSESVRDGGNPGGTATTGSSSSSSSSKSSSSTATSTGYVDERGLWVPYGIGK